MSRSAQSVEAANDSLHQSITRHELDELLAQKVTFFFLHKLKNFTEQEYFSDEFVESAILLAKFCLPDTEAWRAIERATIAEIVKSFLEHAKKHLDVITIDPVEVLTTGEHRLKKADVTVDNQTRQAELQRIKSSTEHLNDYLLLIDQALNQFQYASVIELLSDLIPRMKHALEETLVVRKTHEKLVKKLEHTLYEQEVKNRQEWKSDQYVSELAYDKEHQAQSMLLEWKITLKEILVALPTFQVVKATGKAITQQ